MRRMTESVKPSVDLLSGFMGSGAPFVVGARLEGVRGVLSVVGERRGFLRASLVEVCGRVLLARD